MAVTRVEQVTDDIDGSEGAEHVGFSVDGQHYEIDLGPENRARFDEALSLWVGHARRVPGPAGAGRRTSSGSSGTADGQGRSTTGVLVDAKAVRAWAAENGVSVPARGRIPAAVVEQYRAAQG